MNFNFFETRNQQVLLQFSQNLINSHDEKFGNHACMHIAMFFYILTNIRHLLALIEYIYFCEYSNIYLFAYVMRAFMRNINPKVLLMFFFVEYIYYYCWWNGYTKCTVKIILMDMFILFLFQMLRLKQAMMSVIMSTFLI